MSALDDLRAELEAIDTDLVAALARRFEVVMKVAAVKADEGIPVVLPDRIALVLDRVAALAEAQGLDGEMTRRLYRLIIDEAIAMENQHMADQSADS
ncbi:MAG: chorismate mutase [Alphaproteobacteria bacterium]|jgi:4-amino-4-deoxychorismate mutase|nr:chorismate mutase [Alphaproteobacteria bacterium]